MTCYVTDISEVENVGALDRVNRLLTAMTLIAVAVLFTAIPSAAVVGIVAVAIYAGLTAFIGWDPVYAMVKAMHKQTAAHAPEPVGAVHRQEETASADSYKKAA